MRPLAPATAMFSCSCAYSLPPLAASSRLRFSSSSDSCSVLTSYFEMPIRREMYSRSLGRLPPSTGHQVVLEVDGDAAGGQLAVAAREVEGVVPAVGVEGVGQQRGAEDELDLVAGLADLQLASISWDTKLPCWMSGR
jgi:hypothetical protein